MLHLTFSLELRMSENSGDVLLVTLMLKASTISSFTLSQLSIQPRDVIGKRRPYEDSHLHSAPLSLSLVTLRLMDIIPFPRTNDDTEEVSTV